MSLTCMPCSCIDKSCAQAFSSEEPHKHLPTDGNTHIPSACVGHPPVKPQVSRTCRFVTMQVRAHDLRKARGRSSHGLFRPSACRLSDACRRGYAFVNLVDPCWVHPFWQKFDGYSCWSYPVPETRQHVFLHVLAAMSSHMHSHNPNDPDNVIL